MSPRFYLFLAKNIIKRHKGKIGARSKGKDKGSVFWFELPVIN
jgi:signal transduction histidine kinase